MKYDFDRFIERRSTNSLKWNKYDADVIPLWVADMDFNVPEPIIRALTDKVSHGIFGYEATPPSVLDAVCARMERLYGWQLLPEQVVVVPGVVPGINVAARAFCGHGEGVLSNRLFTRRLSTYRRATISVSSWRNLRWYAMAQPFTTKLITKSLRQR